MVYKRLFHEEESYETASKHRRYQEQTAQQSPILEIDLCNYHYQKPPSDGEGENSSSKTQDERMIVKDAVNEDLNGSQNGASGSISNYLWASINARDDYAESERAIHLSFFPNYFELDHRVRALIQSNDIYATLLDHPPRKLVSVGPEYQAVVPEWAPQRFKNSSHFLCKSDARIVVSAVSSDSCLIDEDYNGAKLLGTCVIPMPDLDSPAFNCCLGEVTGSNCNCLYEGSVGCVRQHVIEAREKLRENLGQKIFQELGFCDMGEQVANKWSEEEEQVFHEVVLSNPASLGKNFWYHLSAVFPTRTKNDLVGYYFNVFMLRKRAEQNRFDPQDFDSDNDEWQRSDIPITEEDEDSVVESLVDQDAPICNQENREENFLDAIENEDETDTCKEDADLVNRRNLTGEEDEGDLYDVSEAHVPNSVGHCGPDPVFELSGKNLVSNPEDHDIQDDSCTSYEYQSDRVDSCGPIKLRTDARESSQE